MCKRNQGRRRDPGDEEEKAEKESEDFDNVTAQRGGVLRIHEKAQRGADQRRGWQLGTEEKSVSSSARGEL